MQNSFVDPDALHRPPLGRVRPVSLRAFSQMICGADGVVVPSRSRELLLLVCARNKVWCENERTRQKLPCLAYLINRCESFEGAWGNFFKSFPKKRILFQKSPTKNASFFKSPPQKRVLFQKSPTKNASLILPFWSFRAVPLQDRNKSPAFPSARRACQPRQHRPYPAPQDALRCGA